MVQRLFRRLAGHDKVPNLPNGPLDDRWRVVLGLSKEANLFAAMADVERALNRLDLQVQSLPQQYHRTKAQAQEALSNLRQAVHPQTFGRDWNQLAHLVTAERLDRLGMVADILDQFAPEGIPPEGVIPELLAQVDDLEVSIQASPFPPHIRLVLQGRLEALRWAIANWPLLGGHSVSDAAGALAAALAVELSRLDDADEQGKEVTQGLMRKTVKIVDWVGRCIVVRDVASGASNFISQAGPVLLASLRG